MDGRTQISILTRRRNHDIWCNPSAGRSTRQRDSALVVVQSRSSTAPRLTAGTSRTHRTTRHDMGQPRPATRTPATTTDYPSKNWPPKNCPPAHCARAKFKPPNHPKNRSLIIWTSREGPRAPRVPDMTRGTAASGAIGSASQSPTPALPSADPRAAVSRVGDRAGVSRAPATANGVPRPVRRRRKRTPPPPCPLRPASLVRGSVRGYPIPAIAGALGWSYETTTSARSSGRYSLR